MKFQRYLNEKYLNAIKHNGKTFEVFENPSKKELQELGDVRGLIDTKTKTLYVWDVYLNHANMMKENPIINKLMSTSDVGAYWKTGKGIDRFFTFDAPSNFVGINSDGVDYLSYTSKSKKVLADLNKLYDADWSFMSKWVDPQKIKVVIRDAIFQMEAGMRQKH